VRRDDVFARDGYRCVYCGEVYPVDALSVDHVQPRVRGGDRSGGNLVTACEGCNVLKGHRRLSEFLLAEPTARANFFRLARSVWPRHLRAVEEEMERRGVMSEE
jgi:5-methylcytosine-specific restriction endonuclease McrA